MKYKIILLSILMSYQLSASEEFKFRIKINNKINVEENNNQIVYDQNGFDTDGIHKDTGTIYDQDGYDKTGYDIDGYDKNGFNIEGQGKIECPAYNGPYYYMSRLYNYSGVDFYGMQYSQSHQWHTSLNNTIYWNGVLIGSGSGRYEYYGAFTRVEPANSFIVDNFRYYFKDMIAGWSIPNSNSSNNSYTVCRQKIAM